jgi:hypothetical protein
MYHPPSPHYRTCTAKTARHPHARTGRDWLLSSPRHAAAVQWTRHRPASKVHACTRSPSVVSLRGCVCAQETRDDFVLRGRSQRRQHQRAALQPLQPPRPAVAPTLSASAPSPLAALRTRRSRGRRSNTGSRYRRPCVLFVQPPMHAVVATSEAAPTCQ